jgi:hypothetical protein
MTQWFDDEDPRVQADRLHAANKQNSGWLHAKGRQALGAKQDKKTRMLRDKFTRDDIGFKADLARRERKVPITLPKVGG